MNFSGFWKRCSPDRADLARNGVLLLAALILALSASAPAVAQETGCRSYSIAVAPQPAGHPLPDDVVQLFDGTGKHLEAPFAQPAGATPSPRSGVTILRSLGGIYSLLDTSSGIVTSLAIPENEQPRLASTGFDIQNASEADYLLLTNGSGSVWMVDLTSGDAQNLSTLFPDAGFIESAAFSPDGKTLLVYTGNMGYIVSPSAPGIPQPLAQEPVLRVPGFSADGQTIFFATGRPGATATIHSYDPATSTYAELGSFDQAVLFLAHMGNPLLAMDARDLMAFSPDDPTPRSIFTWEGVPIAPISDVSGRFLLVGDEVSRTTHWYRVDTESGTAQHVVELDGLAPLVQSRVQDSFVFFGEDVSGPGTPDTPYRTFDLVTGDSATPLTQDSNEVWSLRLAGDANGRYALVNAVSPGFGRMWLIDARAGTAASIGTSTGNIFASISPDGCQLAVDVFDTAGEGRTSIVTGTSLTGGAAITIPDALLLGWAETARDSR